MRICLICNQIAAWGKIGGFGTNTRRLARGLAAEGVDVHVIVPRRPGQRRVESLDGFVVHGQSDKEVFFGTELYREIDADIYHGEEPTIAWANACKAMKDRVKLVTLMDPRGAKEWWAHFWHATWKRMAMFPFQFYYENGPVVRRAVRKADGIYVEAKYLIPLAQKVYRLGEKPGVLPKPVDVPEGPMEKAKKPTCIFVGRFDPIKQPEHFFKLAQRMPDVDFIAVGCAHDLGYQKKLESRYFHLPNLSTPGFIDSFRSNELSELLAKSWIFVLPSAKEAFPTAIQEASLNECAIASYVDPFGYVAQYGQVAKEASIHALEATIRNLIEADRWHVLGKLGREFNVANHSTAVSVKAHLDCYRQKLNQ